MARTLSAMKAAGVALVILSGLLFLSAAAGAFTGNRVSAGHVLIATLFLVGGLIVWSLQQIREALIGGHPRDVAAGVDARGYKKPKWERTADR